MVLKGDNLPSGFEAETLLNNYLYNTPEEEVTIHIKLSILSPVKTFYRENHRELDSKVGKKLTLPQPEKRTPKLADVVDMDNAMSYQRDKAILWFFESTPISHRSFVHRYWRETSS